MCCFNCSEIDITGIASKYTSFIAIKNDEPSGVYCPTPMRSQVIPGPQTYFAMPKPRTRSMQQGVPYVPYIPCISPSDPTSIGGDPFPFEAGYSSGTSDLFGDLNDLMQFQQQCQPSNDKERIQEMKDKSLISSKYFYYITISKFRFYTLKLTC